MKIYLYNVWQRLRTSFWFVPGLMIAGAAGFAFLVLYIDERLGSGWVKGFEWIYLNDPDGARELLSTVAGSMITVAGVVFSITIVVLTLASSQFGPRLLRNFIQDRGNQVVLGTFTATFLYCLLVLRRVQGLESAQFVPHMAIAFGVLFAISGLVVLIYYIHHVTSAMQADTVIASVSRELQNAIDRLLPDAVAEPGAEPAQYADLPPVNFLEQSAPIPAARSGYIQAIDVDRLIDHAQRHDLLIYLHHQPGTHLVADTPLAEVWPCSGAETQLIEAINGAFIIGRQPTPEQDVQFAVRQLVEVAVRALSPGINDPFTATSCIDSLTEALAALASRSFPSAFRYDGHGRLRLIVQPPTFADILDAAFNQIRQYGHGSVAVSIRLLEGLALLAPLAQREEDRRALLRHARMITAGCLEHIHEPCDRDDVSSRCKRVMNALGESV